MKENSFIACLLYLLHRHDLGGISWLKVILLCSVPHIGFQPSAIFQFLIYIDNQQLHRNMTITSPTFWLLVLAAFLVPSIAQTVSSTSCASGVHLLLLRGEGTGDDLNVLDTIQNLVLEQIPGSTSLGLPYQHDNSDKQFAAYNGSMLLQQYIAEYATSCPDSKIAILGYSLV